MKRYKNNVKAFTLLELLIAMSLSGFIILGMIQLHQGVVRYIEGTRDMMSIDRQVCLVCNQLERDLSTAYIPFLAKTEKEIPGDKKGEEKPKAQTPEEQKKEEDREKQQRKTFFVGVINDQADITRIKGKKVELLKYISFICTNPLHIYEEKKQRIVRIVYELAVDKAKSTRDLTVYKLLRKETNDLLNTTAKAGESAQAEQKGRVRSYVVADNIKGIFIEYVTKEDKKKDKEKEEKEPAKEIRLSTWGTKEQAQGVVPQKVDIWIDMWNDKKTKTYRFSATLPIMSFPTIDENERKKKEKEKEKEQTDQKKQQQAAGQTQQTAQTPPDLSGAQPDDQLPTTPLDG